MKRIIWNKDLAEKVCQGRRRKAISSKAASELLGFSASKYSRMETGKANYVCENDVRKIEDLFEIKLIVIKDDSILLSRISELETENKMLKTLLINKWNQ